MRKHYPLNSNGAEDAGQMPWTDGVPSTGTQGSYPGHAIVTDAEAELLAAIDAAGLARNGSDLTQLIQAISRGIFLGTFTGSANALVGAIPNSIVLPSLLQNMRFAGVVTTANTGGVTISLTGFNPAIGALPLLRRDGAALQAGDLPLNSPFDFRYDGAAFRLSTPAASETQATAVAAVNAAKTTQYYTPGTYTWVCPTGITKVSLKGRGAGGGGGGSNGAASYGAGGGAGGSYFQGTFAVVPGTSYVITVGAPGTGGAAAGSNGSSGGATSFGALATAPGGNGGSVANGSTPNGPGGVPPANASGGQFQWAGTSGGLGISVSGVGTGGSGGGSYNMSATNLAPIGIGQGYPGQLPGIGGNGGGGNGYAGGAGGPGELWLEY